MRIVCDTTFLDGRDRFEKGDQRTVDDERGARFVANGWAHEEGQGPATSAGITTTDLSVNNSKHAQGARHG